MILRYRSNLSGGQRLAKRDSPIHLAGCAPMAKSPVRVRPGVKIPATTSQGTGRNAAAQAVLPALLCAALGFVLRAARGYRPFPSIDDFTYAPLAWLSHDPTLFPRDTLLRAYPGYSPAWNL